MKTRGPLFLGLLLSALSARSETIGDSFRSTRANLKGHEVLYEEGWTVVTSTKDALDFAYEHGVTKSADAWKEMSTNLAAHNADFRETLARRKSEAKDESARLRVSIGSTGETAEKSLEETRHELGASATDLRKKAFSTFVLGYLELNRRTEKDLADLKAVEYPGAAGIQKDYANFVELVDQLGHETESQRRGLWEKSFASASEDVQREYAASGAQPHAIAGLWRLGVGYVRATYDGIFHPGAITLAATAATGIKLVGNAVLATGESFYYVSRVGYKLISPTVEGGLLGSIALVSWSSEKVIAGTTAGLHAINQVTVVSSQPVAYGGKWLLATTGETAKTAAISAVEIGKGTGTVVVNTTAAGLVLGYNALTAIPTQAALAAANTAWFLVIDGGHLALATAQGRIDGVPIDDLPVGSVVDLKRLREQNIPVQKIDASPSDIEKVLSESAKDLRR